MKIEDILNALPSKEEIAMALSGQSRNNTTGGDLLTALGIFATGMLLGAGFAFLLAPTTGQKLRHDLAEKIGEVGHKLGRSEEELRHDLAEKISEVSHKLARSEEASVSRRPDAA